MKYLGSPLSIGSSLSLFPLRTLRHKHNNYEKRNMILVMKTTTQLFIEKKHLSKCIGMQIY